VISKTALVIPSLNFKIPVVRQCPFYGGVAFWVRLEHREIAFIDPFPDVVRLALIDTLVAPMAVVIFASGFDGRFA
jgi:hypothetical protein